MAPKLTVNGRRVGEYDDLAVHRTLTVNGMDLYKLLNSGLSQFVPGASAIYLFNEGAGTVLRDFSGNGNDGTLGAGAAAPAWGATGLSFDGGDNVVCAALTGLSTGFTVQIVSNASTDAAVGALVSQCSASTATGTGFYLAKSLTAGRHIFNVYDGAGNKAAVNVPDLTNGTWNVITCTFNGTSIQGWANLTAGTAVDCVGLTEDTADKLTLGKLAYSTGYPFAGGIAVVLVYPFALTSAQIALNAAALETLVAPRGIDINL